jgi:hypothetical protein
MASPRSQTKHSAAAALALATAPLAVAEPIKVPADPFADMPDDYRNWASVLSQV